MSLQAGGSFWSRKVLIEQVRTVPGVLCPVSWQAYSQCPSQGGVLGSWVRHLPFLMSLSPPNHGCWENSPRSLNLCAWTWREITETCAHKEAAFFWPATCQMPWGAVICAGWLPQCPCSIGCRACAPNFPPRQWWEGLWGCVGTPRGKKAQLWICLGLGVGGEAVGSGTTCEPRLQAPGTWALWNHLTKPKFKEKHC